MTTEGKGSVLKTALGLENLKGLGDTLKQIKELKGTIDEAQQTLAGLAKDNSPIGKALAQLIEAEGVKALSEGSVNALQEGRRQMAEELETKDKTIEALAAKNKELEEDRVIHEVTEKLTGELDRRLPKSGGGDGSGESKLYKALEGVVSDYLEKRLLGSGGEGSLTSEQIRSVIKEEVAAVGGGNKKPEDMVNDLVNALTMGDTLREKLGVAGIGGRLLQSGQGGDSGLRTDLVKILLEDQRDTLKIEREHEAKMEWNKNVGTMASAVKENLGTGIAAITAAVEEVKAGTGAKPSAPAPQPQIQCSCGVLLTLPAGDWLEMQCPKCQQVWTREQVKEALGT